ncbi:hypothetical protein OIU85_024614 [Salix viminalis]|uniref:Pentatricopeptide repeat-containing protein n=1 Tax=Salix viminalis TaxID=40686 RepID=A0A9Q0U181_SALVM|nr:hypothetical protein OIU85_024614 [Salix viminalis]
MTFLTPNSLASILETAVSTHSSLLGRATHAQILKTLQCAIPPFLSIHLISMYSKLDLPNSAQLLLQLTPTRCVVTWTALISGSVQTGYFSSALLYFSKMRHENIKPNDFTFPCVFKASTALCLPLTGKQIHVIAFKLGQINDKFVGCSAFDMYSKTGLKLEAQRLFDETPLRNVAVWNAYISNAVLDGRPRKAIDTFIKFRRVGGEPDLITLCAFMNACADARYLDLGRQLHGFVIRSGFEGDVSVANGIIDFLWEV